MNRARNKKISLRVATYNVHKCRGLDGRADVARIAAVLKPLKADIIALQEVVGPSLKKPGQEEELAMRLNMVPLLAPARSCRGHLYGNAILSRLQVIRNMTYDLSYPGMEPRLCQRADVMLEGHTVHIYNVHLGTSAWERSRQAKKLVNYVSDDGVHGPKILLGDFNEWKEGPATGYLNDRLNSIDLIPHLTWRKTYPGILPIFHLDHLYYSGHVEILSLYVPRGWRALMASDHLPMLAELNILVKDH
jgi:endonuclease/exonuclease/phosphatase family metal-dependent hydrolase